MLRCLRKRVKDSQRSPLLPNDYRTNVLNRQGLLVHTIMQYPVYGRRLRGLVTWGYPAHPETFPEKHPDDVGWNDVPFWDDIP